MYQTLLANGVDVIGKKLSDDQLIDRLRDLGFDVGEPPKVRAARRKKQHVDQLGLVPDDTYRPGDR
jgi:hypothetical protein